MTLSIEGIEDPQDPGLKNALEIVCKYVLRIFETKVARVPPLGIKPIVIRPAPDNIPRSCFDVRILAGQYPINLTCLTARYYNQLVYQFAHELCHVYLLPHDVERVGQFIFMQDQSDQRIPWNNWFAESICFTMSYLCLRMMPQEWRRLPPPFPDRKSYAPNFIHYRQNDISKYLGELNIPSENKTAEWVQSRLPTLIEECTEEDRAEQSACAIVIERTFLKHMNAWGAICNLGDCIDFNNTDFDRWHNLTAIKKQRQLINELIKIFKEDQ